jgi:hypothetical protein
MLSQREVFDVIHAPGSQAHQKRFAIAGVPDEFAADPAKGFLPCAASKALIEDVHSFMATHVEPYPVDVCLSGFALSLYEALEAAVQDVLKQRNIDKGYYTPEGN